MSYLGSISPEEGIRLSLGGGMEDDLWGSEHRARVLRAELTTYTENPWASRHVWMTNLFFGTGSSDYGRRRLFSIAGMPRRDLLLDILQVRLSGGRALRGFGLEPFAGDVLAASTLEYRFPLYDIERGVSTLPLYVRTLHAAVFFDGAAIADDLPLLWQGRHASVGGELRLNTILTYALPVTIRVGYGQGLGRDRRQRASYLLLSASL